MRLVQRSEEGPDCPCVCHTRVLVAVVSRHTCLRYYPVVPLSHSHLSGNTMGSVWPQLRNTIAQAYVMANEWIHSLVLFFSALLCLLFQNVWSISETSETYVTAVCIFFQSICIWFNQIRKIRSFEINGVILNWWSLNWRWWVSRYNERSRNRVSTLHDLIMLSEIQVN